MSDVLVLGDANPDLILQGDVVPRFGQAEQLLSSAELVVGGSGAIVAHGLARLGRSVRLVATTGSDPFGDLMGDLLAAAGVDVSGVDRSSGSGTGVTVVLAGESDRAVLTYTGAVSDLTAAHGRSAVETAAAEGARHLHVSSLFLLPGLTEALPDLLALAHGQGMTTSLDTNFDPAERWNGVLPLLPHLDWMLPNRTEVLALATGIGPELDGDVVAAAAALAAKGPVVVVKDGAAGAVEVHPDGTVRRSSAPEVVVRDTTGAGDTFDAAYLDSRLRGLDDTECLRRATLAGALSTTAVGGTAGQPTYEQLQANGKDTYAPRHQ